jgi:hypothetical protein
MRAFSDHPFHLGGVRSSGGTPILPLHKAGVCKTERELSLPFQSINRENFGPGTQGMRYSHYKLYCLGLARRGIVHGL